MNRERKEALQRVLMSLGFCIKANTRKPPGLSRLLFITIVFLSYCFHRSCLETSFSHSWKKTSENTKDSGWEQEPISSHSQCRKNGTPVDSLRLAPSHQQMEGFCMILCSITNLGGLQELWKHFVSLLWTSSLLRSGCSQWLMLSSESPKGPSSYSVLPGEATAQEWERASQTRQLRRTSRTCGKIGMVSKEKTVACTEKKNPYVNTTKIQ